MSETNRVFFGEWSNFDGMWGDFGEYTDAAPLPPAIDVLWASYEYEDYSGSAWVILEDGGKLYEVHGSHCSCNGLEGQWDPEATSWEFVAKELKGHIGRGYSSSEHSPEALIRLTLLVSAHVPFLDAVEGGSV